MMSALLGIVLLTQTPFTVSPALMWRTEGKWGYVAHQQCKKAMAGIVESESGMIRLHRQVGPANPTPFLFAPHAQAVVSVVTNGDVQDKDIWAALQVDVFINKRAHVKQYSGIVAECRKRIGL
jgi:hypothetical protein